MSTTKTYHCWDEDLGYSYADEVEAVSHEAAAEAYGETLLFVDYCGSAPNATALAFVSVVEVTADFDIVDDDHLIETHRVELEPEEPDCTGAEHVWQERGPCGSDHGQVKGLDICVVCGLERRWDNGDTDHTGQCYASVTYAQNQGVADELRWRLDTGDGAEPEYAEGTRDSVMDAICHHNDLDELPADWTLTLV